MTPVSDPLWMSPLELPHLNDILWVAPILNDPLNDPLLNNSIQMTLSLQWKLQLINNSQLVLTAHSVVQTDIQTEKGVFL